MKVREVPKIGERLVEKPTERRVTGEARQTPPPDATARRHLRSARADAES